MDKIILAPTSKTQSRQPNSKTLKLSSLKIFLVGMPGSGKSYWANVLKKMFGLPSYDLDLLIQALEERSIEEIINKDGEEYFRKAESKMLRLFADKKQYILATGGGTACFGNNMEWMNKQGITIWLKEPIEELAQRLLTDPTARPLLANKQGAQLNEYLYSILQQRKQFYESAKHTIVGDSITESTFAEIIQQYV